MICFNEYGFGYDMPDISEMFAPYACGVCGYIHDTAKVRVVARYIDCSMWRCPNCDALQDDRTDFNGPAQARRIDKHKLR